MFAICDTKGDEKYYPTVKLLFSKFLSLESKFIFPTIYTMISNHNLICIKNLK
jgi:hypothetical protein